MPESSQHMGCLLLQDQCACVYVIDDNWEVCKALAGVFQWAGYNVSPAINSAAFWSAYQQEQPSCLFLNIQMRSEDGFQVLARIAEDAPSLPVISIIRGADVPSSLRATECGAFTSIEKPLVPARMLEEANRAIGESNRRLNKLQTFFDADKAISRLSDREHEVFELVTNGFRNRDIAELLSITIKTVEVHRAAIKVKLGVSELSDLIALAKNHTLVATA